jgi:hypothetical protein
LTGIKEHGKKIKRGWLRGLILYPHLNLQVAICYFYSTSGCEQFRWNMKLIETADDQKTVRLGIVKLGTAVGKMKYALIDETDIPVIHEYKFDARLEIDKNGDGIRVIAMGHPKSAKHGPLPLQNILWQHRHGPIEDGYTVLHLNGITMDNRVDNLTLVPKWCSRREQDAILQARCTEPSIWEPAVRDPVEPSVPYPTQTRESLDGEIFSDDEFDEPFSPGERNKIEKRRRGENSLYWKAITQLLTNETDEQRNASGAPFSRAYYTTDGELISRDCPSFYFFECHLPACTAVETEPREFAMCGRCQQARYCSRDCQQLDWTSHRDNCNETHRRSNHSSRSIRSGRSYPRSGADR